MLKRLIVLPLIAVFLMTAAVVSAQEDELPSPGITPDSPLYFLDTLGDNFGLALAFGPEAKARKAAEIAGEKAAEVRAMAEAGKPEAAGVAADRYGSMVSTAASNLAAAARTGDIDAALAEVVARATSVHLDVLSGVLDQVPEQAKGAIERAMQAGQRGADEALGALEGTDRGIPADVQERIQRFRETRGAPEGFGPPEGVTPEEGELGPPEGVGPETRGAPEGTGETRGAPSGTGTQEGTRGAPTEAGPPGGTPGGRP